MLDAALDVLLANSITANLDQGSSFALGECIVKLCSHLKQRDSSALTTSFTRTIETLISKAAVLGIDQTTAIVADKIHHCTILVVFVKNMNQLVDFISFKHIDNMLAIFLAFLRSNDGYLQDLSSLGLCYLYQACEHLNTDPRVDGSQGLGRYKSVQDYLAQEIANVVTRRKRPLQPAGYDPSGRGSSTNNADAANTTETNNTTNTTQMDETIRAVLNEAGNQRDEVLEAAAAMAATELNSAMGEANRSSNLSHLDPAENGYGAYSKVCSIARKVSSRLF